MNKQTEKLISADGVLSWINGVLIETDSEHVRYLFSCLKERLENGSFDPDPIPLPTLKPGDKEYRCGECHISSTAPEWNKTTADFCNELNIQRIDDLPGALEGFYICPKCGTSIEYHDVEVIGNE